MKITTGKLLELCGDMSASEFARRVGIPQQSMSRYLVGGSDPNAETIVKICTTFHVTADWLLGLADDSEKSSNRNATDGAANKRLQSIKDDARAIAKNANHLVEAVERLEKSL